MSKSRHIRVRSVRRRPVDASKLGRALIELAQAQREKEAQAEHQAKVEDKLRRPKREDDASSEGAA